VVTTPVEKEIAMSLEEELRKQLTAAMRAKDTRTSNVVRAITTEISRRKTAPGFKGEVDDALITDVIATYKKSMEKARKQFEEAGEKGAAHAAELGFEIDWCTGMLPKQVGEEELRAAVAKAIADTGTKDAKGAGRVIGTVKKLYGDTADAALIKKLVDEALKPA
jgi:uncharacterized protein